MSNEFENEPRVIVAIETGNKVQAIKELRKVRGIGLREAKDLVDAYLEENPLTNQNKEMSGSNFGWLIWGTLIFVGYFIVKNYL